MIFHKDNLNLICHSLGCNYALILSSMNNIKINKQILISPELKRIDKKEKELLLENAKAYETENYQVGNFKTNLDMGKLKLLILLHYSAYLARNGIKNIDTQTLLVHAKGDIYVSLEGLNLLRNKEWCKFIEYDTKHHNILRSNEEGKKLAKDIVYFLKR